MDYLLYISIVVFACFTTYYLFLFLKYKSKNQLQAAKIVQLYLDKQFIGRILSTIFDSNKSEEEKIVRIFDDIKEYYDFEDIILYNMQDRLHSPFPESYNKGIIIKYINQNLKEILSDIKYSKFIIKPFIDNKHKYTLYILSLSEVKDGEFAIFVHNGDYNLNTLDIDTFRHSIQIILSGILSRKIFH